MAVGNIGNLLQHFVALRVAEAVIQAQGLSEEPIEYVDCYAMAPWEPITGQQPQGFVGRVKSFPEKIQAGDLVATTFCAAWAAHYGRERIPQHPRKREYPNTATLLRTAFPSQHWRMRLHENDSTQLHKRDDLIAWAGAQNPGVYEVGADWERSPLISNCPVPIDRPALVMLDPFQIVDDRHTKAGESGCLSESGLRGLVGRHSLDLRCRLDQGGAAPVAVMLFSYAESNTEQSNAIVRRQFEDARWTIEGVKVGPFQGRVGECWHQGWVVSSGIAVPLLGAPLQQAWDEWNQ